MAGQYLMPHKYHLALHFWWIFQGDIKNGYNEISHESILAAMKEKPDLQDTLVFTHLMPKPRSYIAMGSGTDNSESRKESNKEQY
jgi:hypothetical protein